ncbi:MAG: peptide chain release factor 1 [Actinobacteria bacterium]|nr:peptide chain release factor 1 [Actinomycetota bacterium]
MSDRLFARLDELERDYHELTAALADPEIFTDPPRYAEVAKRQSDLSEVVDTYRSYREVTGDAEAARELAAQAGPEDQAAFRQEAEELDDRAAALIEQLRLQLLPKDPHDDRNVIVEIRAGAGGDEAGLFAGELYRMYSRYAERAGWKVEQISASEQGIGGVKEVIFQVSGTGAYSRLKHESGVHRVQRVPQTESGGRVHTSTASVAVMPEAEDVDVTIDTNDLRVDVYRSSGPGGQSVNTTDSAVRISHAPSGLVVSCQDEKSQLQNREKAMRILRARLLQLEQERAARQRAEARLSQIGTGDRSEKIRTYNFPQSRVTDHRIGLSVHNLSEVMDGALSELLSGLIAEEQRRRLEALTLAE